MPDNVNVTADLEAARVMASPGFVERRRSAFDASLLIDRIAHLESRNGAYFDQIRRLKDLIGWLALKYGYHNPEFPEYDPTTETALLANIELSRTWYEVVRGGLRCEDCLGAGYFRVRSDDPDISYRRTCEACDGLGFIEVSG